MPNKLARYLSCLSLVAMLLVAICPDANAQPAQDAGIVDARPSGSGVVVTPIDDARESYLDVVAKYEALKHETDSSARMLLWAALTAGVLKILLDAVKIVGKSEKLSRSMAWFALGLAVPIALLSRYAGGASWLDSVIFAGAGPGAIVVHELVSFFQGKPATA
jgi:hypothetical protein